MFHHYNYPVFATIIKRYIQYKLSAIVLEMNKRKTLPAVTSFVLLLSCLVCVWFFINNLTPIMPATYSLALLLAIGVLLAFFIYKPASARKLMHHVAKASRHQRFAIIALPLVIFLGLGIRFFIYSNFTYEPVSDPLTHFYSAQALSNGNGMVNDSYIARFPYLAAYNSLLATAMGVISDPWLATVVINSAISLIGAALMYVLLARLTKRASMIPVAGFGAWFMSPFEILFSVISLPIVVINLFIIGSILIATILFGALRNGYYGRSLCAAILFGVVAGIGNSFRPIFSIAVIAIAIALIYLLMAKNINRKVMLLSAASFLTIVLTFSVVQSMYAQYVAAETKLPVTMSSSWSMYVGSSSESDGKWNDKDNSYSGVICSNVENITECQTRLRQAAFDRYKNLGISGTANLFVRKLHVLSSGQSDVYNANDSIGGYKNSRTFRIMTAYTVMFVLVLFALASRYLYNAALQSFSGKKIDASIVFASLLLLGFFFSIVLVETSPRYAQVLYPLFIMLAALSVGVGYAKKSKSKKIS